MRFWIAVGFLALLNLGCAEGFEALRPRTLQATSPSSVLDPSESAGTLKGLRKVRSISLQQILDDATDVRVPPEIVRRLGPVGQTAVDVYAIEYVTRDLKNQSIRASGAIVVPQKQLDSPVAVYMHATLTADQKGEAPSFGRGPEVTALAAIAVQGYIILAPDYIGYGSSQDQEHPYLADEPTATAAVDLITAAKSALPSLGATPRWNDGLYLFGYSQGGHGAMALHRALETRQTHTVAVSVVGGGPYDLLQTVREALNQDAVEGTENYFWAIVTLLRSIGREDLTDKLVKPELADTIRVEDFVLGRTTGPANLRDVVSPEVRDEILSDASSPIRDLIDAQNAYADWTPKAPVRLFHGRGDRLVSFRVSEEALAKLRARGADVELLSNRDGHTQAVLRYFTEVSLQFAIVRTGRLEYQLASDILDDLENGTPALKLSDILKLDLSLLGL